MTLTIIGISIIILLLVMVSIVNFIMSMFNSLLFNVLRILTPIGLITGTTYSLINYLWGDVTSPHYLDNITGIVTLMYCLYILGYSDKKRFKILTLILTVPMLLYLLNPWIETGTIYLFNFSINHAITDLLYRYTMIGTLDGLMAHVTENITNYVSLIPNIDTSLHSLYIGISEISFSTIFNSDTIKQLFTSILNGIIAVISSLSLKETVRNLAGV